MPIFPFRSIEITRMPMGDMSVRPDHGKWVLTKRLKQIAVLRLELGFHLVIYIDDIQLMAESKEMALEQVSALVFLLQCIRFTINMEKTVTQPTQITGSGFYVNIVDGAKSPCRQDSGGVPKTSGRGADNSLHHAD